MPSRYLTRAGFAAWLRSQGTRKTVGRACRACDCPIARYLKSQGCTKAAIDPCEAFFISPAGCEAREDLPRWASRFVVRADSLDFERRITAGRALVILEGTRLS